jgi:predicted  nucleic acid-binding Zn-ribbon protein
LEDHLTYIDSLTGEISLTLDNKAELEKHVSQLVKEKESLSDSLDYSVGEILSLEKRPRDQENLLR